MQCLILAGGLGTRMRTVTGTWPKALLPVGNETFIDYQLKWLKLLGVTDVVLALGFGGEEIMRHIEARQSDRAYPQVNYSFDLPTPMTAEEYEALPQDRRPSLLGTGGAIIKATPMLSKDFLVTYGDSFVFLKIKDLITTHNASGKPLTVSIFKNKGQGDKSNIAYSDGRLIKYDKIKPTPDMEYIDYGMSVVNKAYFLKHAPKAQTGKLSKFDFADFMTAAIDQGNAGPFEASVIFREIGSPKGYQGFQDLLMTSALDLKALAKKFNLI